MDGDKELIQIKHNGCIYHLQEDAIEAAYRYKLRQYRSEDCYNHLCDIVFADALMSEEEAKEVFEEEYGMTYDEAASLMDEMIDRFEDKFDCNQDENAMWENAIKSVIEDYRK